MSVISLFNKPFLTISTIFSTLVENLQIKEMAKYISPHELPHQFLTYTHKTLLNQLKS